jgi:hypothetical protein
MSQSHGYVWSPHAHKDDHRARAMRLVSRLDAFHVLHAGRLMAGEPILVVFQELGNLSGAIGMQERIHVRAKWAKRARTLDLETHGVGLF